MKRHLASLALLLATATLYPAMRATSVARADEKKTAAAQPKADPLATKFLADARAARASWANFPGFTADIAVNFDGQVTKGKATVDPTGKVQLTGLDNKEEEAWAKRTLASIVGHRLDSAADRDTPCAFADNNENHPLGRAIIVLNDELHSSYRIRDNQITEVNRKIKDQFFTISVLENRPNAEGKFLSVSFVVNYWNADSPSTQLLKSETNHQSWKRIGKFDLPATVLVVTAGTEGSKEKTMVRSYSTRSLTLSNHQLK